MNYYQHHIGDFNNATRHLSLVERAIYRDLLDMYYDTEKPIDASNLERLARRLQCATEDQTAALKYVLEEFLLFRMELISIIVVNVKLLNFMVSVSKPVRLEKHLQKRAEKSNKALMVVHQMLNNRMAIVQRTLKISQTKIQRTLKQR